MKNLKTIDVALYIFILTSLGYFITFSYGWGYNSYFSIPIHFIDFSILNITRSISLLAIGVSSLLVYNIFFLDKTNINWLFSRVGKIEVNSKLSCFFQFLCIAGLVGILVLAKKENNTQFTFFYFWIGLILCILYFYLRNYLKAFFIMTIVVLLMLPYILGMIDAKNQSDFFIVDNNKDYLILTFGSDKIIAAKYDLETNTIYPEFRILPMEKLEEKNNDLSLIKINKPSIAESKKMIE